MQKQVFIIEHDGVAECYRNSLTEALRYIGTRINGRAFGCMLVTVYEATEQGYRIRQCKI
jgi:hypothetical protein